MNSLLSINHTKKCLFLFLFVGFFAKAQTLHIGSNTSEKLTITENTSLYIEGLTISPSSDFHLSNTKLSKLGTTTNTISSSINRSYLFNTATASFTGSLKITYQDSELNGETENSLGLVLFLGSTWDNQTTTSSDTSSNFIVASVNGKTLKELTLSNYVNNPPTDISLTSNIISETASIGSLVGTLSATDPDTSISSLTFSFTSSGDAQDNDNGSFTISGTSLLTSTTLDYETKTSYNIYVNVSDGTSNYAKAFTVSVTNVLEPVTDLGFEAASVVTDGLVLHLDAADSNSYSGTGETWNDLSGNNNDVSLQNDGSIDFDSGGKFFNTGNDGYFTKSNGNNIPVGNSNYTLAVYVNQPQWGSSNGFISIGGFGSSYKSNALRTKGGSYAFRHYWWANDLDPISNQVSLNNWLFIVAKFDGTTRSVWVNGILAGQDTPTGHNVLNSDIQVSKTYGNEYQKGKIRAALIYDRALSEQEIIDSYNYFNGNTSISTSTNIGSAPQYLIAFAVATKVRA